MCTSTIKTFCVEGSGKGASWFSLTRAVVDYDHPTHALLERSINIDFINEFLVANARVAIELSVESARALAQSIMTVLDDAGEGGEFPRMTSQGTDI